MRLYNTTSRQVEEFVPIEEGRIRMYVCGPTVYAPPHLGHGRTAIAFDLIRRYLMFAGWDVTFVSNYTDVEDKIIARASEEGMSPEALARKYERVYDEAMDALGVLRPDITPRATEHIPEMIELIESLVSRGHAYAADSPSGGTDVYFAVRSFDDYGALSHQAIEDLESGARVEPGEHKRDPLDFALWKAAKAGEPSWGSPWGDGRPGWHIECSAMSVRYLGCPFDIHGGGSDLIFPHHENEVAQSEAGLGVAPFARFWLHSGMVNLEGAKMSKSKGHFLSLEDALDAYSPEAIRLLVAQTHYRNQLEFAPELVEECEVALDRVVTFRERAADALGLDPDVVLASPQVSEAEPDAETLEAFVEAMEDDFHTPGAVAALFDLVKRGNATIDRGDPAPLAGLLAALGRIDEVLGVLPPPAPADRFLGEVMELVLDLRRRAREEKDYGTADHIRERLTRIGISVEDAPEGTKWRRRRR